MEVKHGEDDWPKSEEEDPFGDASTNEEGEEDLSHDSGTIGILWDMVLTKDRSSSMDFFMEGSDGLEQAFDEEYGSEEEITAVASSAVASFERELRQQLRQFDVEDQKFDLQMAQKMRQISTSSNRTDTSSRNEREFGISEEQHDNNLLFNGTRAAESSKRVEALPDIVDFTPEYAPVPMKGTKPSKVVLSCSDPLPALPAEDDVFRWHKMAAFVETTTVTATEIHIERVDVSVARELNPYTFQCTLPYVPNENSERYMCLVGVRQYHGTDPMCQGVAYGVAIALKEAWKKAERNVLNDAQDIRPLLITTAEASHFNVRILSQLTEDAFEFEASDPLDPSPAVVTVPSSEEISGPPVDWEELQGEHLQHPLTQTYERSLKFDTQPGSMSHLPAPPAVMAMVATALPGYPNPPAKAVVEPDAVVAVPNTVFGMGDAGNENRRTSQGTSSSTLMFLANVPGGKAAIADALEATVAGGGSSSDEDSTPRRKSRHKRTRSSIEVRSSSVSSSAFTTQAASRWFASPSVNCSDETVGEEVDRYCKIRFVEKLGTVINESEEAIENGKGKNHDSWSIPALSGAVVALRNDTNASAVDHNDLGVSGTINGSTKNVDDGTEGSMTVSSQSGNVLILPDDSELKAMDDDKLDGLLDSLVTRVVESLIEMSASSYELQEELNAPDKSGFSLLHYASLYNLQSLIPLLLSRGANPDTPTVRGKLTPLHLACGAGNWAIAELLVRNGCAVEVRDSFGSSPADHAIRNGFSEIADWLREKMGDDSKRREENRTTETRRQSEIDVFAQPESGPCFGSSPDGLSAVAMRMDEENRKHLVHAAFSNLSLTDKVALSVLVKKRQTSDEESHHRKYSIDNAQNEIKGLAVRRKSSDLTDFQSFEAGRAKAVGRTGAAEKDMPITISEGRPPRGAHKSGLSSWMSDHDKESINAAMKLMSKMELDDLAGSSQEVDNDARNWMIRRNFKSLREAVDYVETQRKEQKRHLKDTGNREDAMDVSNPQSTGLQDQQCDIDKRSIKSVKDQALSDLVLRKHMLRAKNKRKGNSVGGRPVA